MIGEVLDYVIINKQAYILQSCNLQFGLKANYPKVQCIFVLQEIIAYYVSDRSACHVVVLNAYNAFDSVHCGIIYLNYCVSEAYVLIYVKCSSLFACCIGKVFQ